MSKDLSHYTGLRELMSVFLVPRTKKEALQVLKEHKREYSLSVLNSALSRAKTTYGVEVVKVGYAPDIHYWISNQELKKIFMPRWMELHNVMDSGEWWLMNELVAITDMDNKYISSMMNRIRELGGIVERKRVSHTKQTRVYKYRLKQHSPKLRKS